MTISLGKTYNGPLLVLNAKLDGYYMKPRSILITIIYKVQYKLHNSKVLKPPSKKGEIVYFLTNTLKANQAIPATIP